MRKELQHWRFECIHRRQEYTCKSRSEKCIPLEAKQLGSIIFVDDSGGIEKTFSINLILAKIGA